MNAITTVLSSVGSFSDTTKNQYSSMIALANEVLRQVNEMLSFVQGEKNKVEKQMIRVEKVEEEISSKTRGYYIEMESTGEIIYSSAFLLICAIMDKKIGGNNDAI